MARHVSLVTIRLSSNTYWIILASYVNVDIWYYLVHQIGFATFFQGQTARPGLVFAGCHRLKLQLQKHRVPVKRFALLWQPWESHGARWLREGV
jgi:hypothetical protein